MIDYLRTLPTSNDGTLWGQYRSEIRQRILNEGVSNFKSWSIIHLTMYVGDPTWNVNERELASKYFDLTGLDSNDVHQAHHLSMWMEHVGPILPDMKNIVELGGGYGAMCKLILDSGYTGPYTIIDYPEMIALQQYTLGYRDNVTYINSLEVSDVPDLEPDLFIALWSLSEVEPPLRWMFDPLLDKVPHALVGYGHKWNDFDNVDYFSRFGLESEYFSHIGGFYGIK